jgi:hypothetical protein
MQFFLEKANFEAVGKWREATAAAAREESIYIVIQ